MKPIIVFMCSLPEREQQLKQVINSLSPQVDYIYLALNNYKSMPEWIKTNNKIIAYKRNNQKGDAERFMFCDILKSHYAFICDDDLIYPPDYVSKALQYIDVYPQTVLGYHGRIMKPRPLKSYYKDRAEMYHCLSDVEQMHEVDIISNCNCFYDSDYLTIRYDAFLTKNMSDIYFNYQAKQQGLKRIVLPHNKDYFKYLQVPNTIHEQSFNNCEVQTNFINQFWDK